MQYYAVVCTTTVLMALMAGLLWRKSKTPAFAVGALFLYFWTLFGSWSVLQQKLGDGEPRQFDYLYYKMFPVYLDSDYFWALILYSGFCLITLTTAYIFIHPPRATSADLRSRLLCISHGKILLVSSVASLVSYLLIRDQLALAAELDTNMHFVNPEQSRFFTLHQILDRAALTPLAIGLAVFVAGRSARYVTGRRSTFIMAGYLVCFGIVVLLNLLTGTRNNLMFAASSAVLFYLANTVRPRKLILLATSVSALAVLMFIGVVRDGAKSREIRSLDWSGKLTYALTDSLGKQNESFAAHFSMYGVLHKRVPPTYGSSFVWLMFSAVPRIILPGRPMEIYEYYVESVGAIQGQGYNVHHATGWYLNFGVTGVVIGAAFFGWIWAWLFNRFHRSVTDSHISRVFSVFAFWNFTAFIPMLTRNGPEGYKSALVEGILIQTVILGAATLNVVRRGNRPRIVYTRMAKRARALMAAHPGGLSG